jgi:hypothetical protein
MDVARMSAVVNRLSVVLSTPVGVEIVMSSAIPAGAGTRPGAGSQAYDLTGLAMGDALGKVTDWMPEYAWSLDDGVYHLRPRAANPVSHALDIRVDRFAGRFDDVRMAATAIRDLIDRSLPTRSPVTGTGSPVLSANPGPDMQKAVAFDATNVSLRQLLDTFATQHGRLSWMMEARRQTNGLNALLLRIQTFDGVTLNLSPIVR